MRPPCAPRYRRESAGGPGNVAKRPSDVARWTVPRRGGGSDIGFRGRLTVAADWAGFRSRSSGTAAETMGARAAGVQGKSPSRNATGFVAMNNPGSDLLSHAVSHAVPSAVEGLTSVFGMGTGV